MEAVSVKSVLNYFYFRFKTPLLGAVECYDSSYLMSAQRSINRGGSTNRTNPKYFKNTQFGSTQAMKVAIMRVDWRPKHINYILLRLIIRADHQLCVWTV